MTIEQTEEFIKFIKSNDTGDNKIISDFLNQNIYSLNLLYAELSAQTDAGNSNDGFGLFPNHTHDQKLVKINFWYFYLYLISTYKDQYINELTAYNFFTGKSSFYDSLDLMKEQSFLKSLEKLFINKDPESIKEETRKLISKKNYIPLLCARFISKKTPKPILKEVDLKTFLTLENLRFHQMVSNYFRKENESERTNTSSKIPEALLDLMNQIDKDFSPS